MTAQNISALLRMPPSLRRLLLAAPPCRTLWRQSRMPFGASCRTLKSQSTRAFHASCPTLMPQSTRSLHDPCPTLKPQTRAFHASCPTLAKQRPMRRPLTIGAFTIPHSPVLPITQQPFDQLLSECATPGGPDVKKQLTRLFTRHEATLYHSTSNFYSLKKNTRVPEICILGRSNVGKSTLVNAIANRRENELAYTSSKAGKTRAMNAYGFGPPPLMKDLADTDTATKRSEDLPRHAMFIVDMPGYGFRSHADWGHHISRYLQARDALRGAVVLIDGQVGPKDGDRLVLELLCQAGVRTTIVLTKADKAASEEQLRATCTQMWNIMREIEGEHVDCRWKWDPDIFVTAVGAVKKEIGADTVDMARLAIARLAGLIETPKKPGREKPRGYGGAVVSFDDLKYAPSKPSPAASGPKSGGAKGKQKPAEQRDGHKGYGGAVVSYENLQYASAKSSSPASKPNAAPPIPPAPSARPSGFTSLERAATEQNPPRRPRTGPRDANTSSDWGLSPQSTHKRGLHTTPARRKPTPLRHGGGGGDESQTPDPKKDQVNKVLRDFVNSLKAATAQSARERHEEEKRERRLRYAPYDPLARGRRQLRERALKQQRQHQDEWRAIAAERVENAAFEAKFAAKEAERRDEAAARVRWLKKKGWTEERAEEEEEEERARVEAEASEHKRVVERRKAAEEAEEERGRRKAEKLERQAAETRAREEAEEAEAAAAEAAAAEAAAAASRMEKKEKKAKKKVEFEEDWEDDWQPPVEEDEEEDDDDDDGGGSEQDKKKVRLKKLNKKLKKKELKERHKRKGQRIEYDDDDPDAFAAKFKNKR